MRRTQREPTQPQGEHALLAVTALTTAPPCLTFGRQSLLKNVNQHWKNVIYKKKKNHQRFFFFFFSQTNIKEKIQNNMSTVNFNTVYSQVILKAQGKIGLFANRRLWFDQLLLSAPQKRCLNRISSVKQEHTALLKTSAS